MLSKELQQGKAAEHLVVADLILRGHNAFLTDQGLSFDVVSAESDGKLIRVQVRSTAKRVLFARRLAPIYRFGLRRAKRTSRRMSSKEIDVIAFVALDTRVIGYLSAQELTSRETGDLVQAIEFQVRSNLPPGRIYSTGKQRAYYGRCLDDYPDFPPTGRTT